MSFRFLKVKKELERTILTILLKLNFFSVIIKNVIISKDLRYVTFEISSINDEHISSESLLHLINKKLPVIKNELKQYITLKYFPIIRFFSDSHNERIQNIEKILKKLEEEKSNQQSIVRSIIL